MEKKQNTIVAISGEEYQLWGCPYCGYRSGSTHISTDGTSVVFCGECGKSFAVLAKGVKKSVIGFGNFYPKLQEHPRKGTPSHGKPDKRPESGGEFFRSRGIGLDNCTCFVCGTHDRDGKGNTMFNNIAAFVECRAAGERVVAMFPIGARLDYREYEPDRVQVKIGACDRHLDNLKVLDELCKDGILTEEKINKAVRGKGFDIGGLREILTLSTKKFRSKPESFNELEMLDLHFLVIGVDKKEAESHREALIKILGDYPQHILWSAPNYIKVGAELDSQEMALQLFALGKVLGFWNIITPETLGFKGKEANKLAGRGLILISGCRRDC